MYKKANRGRLKENERREEERERIQKKKNKCKQDTEVKRYYKNIQVYVNMESKK